MTASLLGATSGRIDTVALGEALAHSEVGMLIQTPTAETRDDSLLAPFTRQVQVHQERHVKICTVDYLLLYHINLRFPCFGISLFSDGSLHLGRLMKSLL